MKNLQMIEIKYLSSTSTKGARIKLIDTRFNVSITLARDYNVDATEQAIRFLEERGFNVIGKSYNEIKKIDYLFIDNFEGINNI